MLGKKYITPHGTAQIATRNQQRHTHCPLPGRRKIIADPRQQADERGIQASGDEEEEEIPQSRQARVRDDEQRQETRGGDAVRTHDEHPAHLLPVRKPGEGDDTDDAERVHRHRQQLRHGARVAQVLDDGGRGVGEAVDGDGVAEPDDDGEPDLPLAEGGAEGGPGEWVVVVDFAGGGASVLGQAADEEGAFVRLEEGC